MIVRKLFQRQKKLLSEALNYESKESHIKYGTTTHKFSKPKIELPTKYFVLVQNASWPTKQWPVSKWQQLVKYLEDQNIPMLLPSGNLEEIKRAKEICSVSRMAQAIDLMPLNEIAYIIKNATLCICSDTGLVNINDSS